MEHELWDGAHDARDAGFDTDQPGTPERQWREALATVPRWRPAGIALVVVAPHPDDESLGAGGLIHECASGTALVRVISVTDGEAARGDVPDLAAVRRRELQAALSCLAPRPVQWERLSVPDVKVSAFESSIEAAIDARVPTGAMLAAPFEHDGHPDHDAVGRVCLRIARRRAMTLLRYPIWSWHQRGIDAFREARLVCFELSPSAQLAKARALRCFVSQLRAGPEPAVLPAHVLEYFARPYETFLL
jgi:LmbE family N-acetylglucosaminyl deacetylase